VIKDQSRIGSTISVQLATALVRLQFCDRFNRANPRSARIVARNVGATVAGSLSLRRKHKMMRPPTEAACKRKAPTFGGVGAFLTLQTGPRRSFGGEGECGDARPTATSRRATIGSRTVRVY